MILNSSIKIAIMQKYNNLNKEYTSEEVLATEILFYLFILSLIKSDSSNRNNINQLVSSYSAAYRTKFIELKHRSTAYLSIINFLKNNQFNNLLSLSENDISTVSKIFSQSKEIIPFNSISFNELMYGIFNVDSQSKTFLKNIHFNIMVPIFKYYEKKYNIQESDFLINSAEEVPNNIGKKISFQILNVSSAIVFSDILNKKININNILCELEYPYIVLTIL